MIVDVVGVEVVAREEDALREEERCPGLDPSDLELEAVALARSCLL